MTDILALTEEILKLTRSMLEAAQKSQWDKVQVHEQRRQALMRGLNLNDEPAGHGSQAIAANLQETVVINNKLIDLGVHARVELGESMGSLQRGRKANLAYNGMR